MRRILGFALLSILFSATVMAAQNSQTFYLATAARAGNVQLPRGICEVAWSALSGCRRADLHPSAVRYRIAAGSAAEGFREHRAPTR